MAIRLEGIGGIVEQPRLSDSRTVHCARPAAKRSPEWALLFVRQERRKPLLLRRLRRDLFEVITAGAHPHGFGGQHFLALPAGRYFFLYLVSGGIQKPLRFQQIGGVETLAEPLENPLQQVPRSFWFVLPLP